MATSIIPTLQKPAGTIIVPNGTYSGGVAADGGLVHSDWLFVVAQTPGGVIIEGELQLHRAKKIVFVGFKYDAIRVMWGCEDILFWYCNASNTESPATDNTNSLVCFHDEISGARSNRITVAGGDLGTPTSGLIGNDCFGLNSCDYFRALGLNVQAHGLWPLHADAIQTTGAVNHTEIGWCNWSGNFQIGEEFGPVADIWVHDTWAHDSPTGNTFVFGHYGSQPAITGKIERVYDWAPHHRWDYHTPVYGQPNVQYPAGSHPEWVSVVETEVTLGRPPEGTVDPAVWWQSKNPYDSYPSFVTGGPIIVVPPPVDLPAPSLKQAKTAVGSSLTDLAEATVSGDLYVVVSPQTAISSVSFAIDGVFARTESTAPFSLAGDNGPGALLPIDTTKMNNGKHVVTADVLRTNGVTQKITASFTVTGGITVLPIVTGSRGGNEALASFLHALDGVDIHDQTTE